MPSITNILKILLYHKGSILNAYGALEYLKVIRVQVVWDEAQESAFLRSSQAVLTLLVHRTHCRVSLSFGFYSLVTVMNS